MKPTGLPPKCSRSLGYRDLGNVVEKPHKMARTQLRGKRILGATSEQKKIQFIREIELMSISTCTGILRKAETWNVLEVAPRRTDLTSQAL